MGLKTRIEKLEEAEAQRYDEAATRLLGILDRDEVIALARGLTASRLDRWDDLPADTQATAWAAYEKMKAKSPADWAVFWGDA